MRYREKKTFFLYGIGRDQEQLCLGNLVLRDYANPTTVRNHIHEKLSDGDLRRLAYISELPANVKITSTSGLKLAIGGEITDVVTLKFPWNSTKTRLVLAEGGHRIELKDSPSFFYKQVLASDDARETLSRWISAAHSDKVTSRFWYRKPKIWMLTGIYTFRNATCTDVDNSSLGAELGLSSALMAAATGFPVGPLAEVAVENGIEITLPMAGDLVWAAQWQQVNLEGVWYRRGIEGSWKLPLSISLYEDRFSSGVMKGGSGDEVAFLEVGERVYGEDDEGEDDKREEDLHIQPADEYDELLEETLQFFEKSIEEEARKEADPEYQARKREALDAEAKADEEFHYACQNFPVGSKEREVAYAAWGLAYKAVCQFRLEKVNI
ncbi:hypothetical protein FANTH_14838 [Fusarium anthophilum]|uniref:Uncharacterized protein n=1 Tax=Fusarium anthophilum TaxID=48485 RepID=A0A8H4YGA4_9HYPO|nr:hypothetical protein FANTH_14838 [Fusarium anthophilum]